MPQKWRCLSLSSTAPCQILQGNIYPKTIHQGLRILQTPVGNRGILEPSPFSRTPAVDLSCKSEYALLALIELSAHHASGEPLQIRQISSKQNIPDRYLEQLLATLRRAGVVKSQRGARGGYLLAREPWKISLYDVVSCIEGFDGQPDADRTPATSEAMVIQDVWGEVRQAAEEALQRYTLQDLLDKRNAKQQLDIMYYI